MKERPVLFNGEMVRAILDDRKTQTRGVIKPQPNDNGEYRVQDGRLQAWLLGDWETVVTVPIRGRQKERALCCPYGVPGEQLGVRETWQVYGRIRDCNWEGGLTYRADHSSVPLNADTFEPASKMWSMERAGRWRPSIHMPRWASRITLEVTEVRVERLQSISPDDCFAEGIQRDQALRGDTPALTATWPVECFRHLWDSINAKRGEYETDTFWLPDTEQDLPAGEYEFSWDGGEWQRFRYWPHRYDTLTDEWMEPCIGDDPEHWMLDVLEPKRTQIRLSGGTVVGVKRVAKTSKRLRVSYAWDANPWVWVIEFRRVTP